MTMTSFAPDDEAKFHLSGPGQDTALTVSMPHMTVHVNLNREVSKPFLADLLEWFAESVRDRADD